MRAFCLDSNQLPQSRVSDCFLYLLPVANHCVTLNSLNVVAVFADAAHLRGGASVVSLASLPELFFYTPGCSCIAGVMVG